MYITLSYQKYRHLCTLAVKFSTRVPVFCLPVSSPNSNVISPSSTYIFFLIVITSTCHFSTWHVLFLSNPLSYLYVISSTCHIICQLLCLSFLYTFGYHVLNSLYLYFLAFPKQNIAGGIYTYGQLRNKLEIWWVLLVRFTDNLRYLIGGNFWNVFFGL